MDRVASASVGLVLGIETATVCGGVSLVSRSGEPLGEITLRSRESHAERILPAVAWLTATVGHSLRECAAVAVSCGPGSFTGLRAGIATAKGLSFSLGVPLFGIPTLEALAANAPAGEGPVCAVLNARRGEVFSALFHAGPAGVRRLGPDRVGPAAALAAELPAACLLIGDLGQLQPYAHPSARPLRLAPQHLSQPRAATIAFLGSVALAESRPTEIFTLAPRYLRPCDA